MEKKTALQIWDEVDELTNTNDEQIIKTAHAFASQELTEYKERLKKAFVKDGEHNPSINKIFELIDSL